MRFSVGADSMDIFVRASKSYGAAYRVADNPYGPFEYGGPILGGQLDAANSAGHHSVLKLPGTDDDWVIC